jgi:O-antigen ligase
LTPGIGGVLLAVSLWFYITSTNRPGRVRKLVLACGIAAALSFLLISSFTIYNTPTSPFHFSIADVRIDPTQRLLAWQDALQTFRGHTFFGKGLGLGVAEVYFMPPSGQMQVLTDAHNTFLNVAGQAGIAGLIPMVLICIAVIHRTCLFPNSPQDVSVMRQCLGVGFVSAFIYQGFVGSFENARHLWVLIGMLLALGRIDELPVKENCPACTLVQILSKGRFLKS